MRIYLALSCGVATFTNLILSFYAQYNHLLFWVPYQFTEYMAFSGIFLSCISRTYISPKRKWLRNILFVIGLLVVGHSRNKAAIILCVIAGPLVWFAVSLLKERIRNFNYFAAIFLIAFPLLVSAGIGGLGKSGPTSFLKIGSANTSSLTSRGLLAETALTAVKDNPSLLVTGLGWGSFSDLLTRYARLDNVSFVDDSPWDALIRGDWHSHNNVLETLLSTGGLGAVLWLGYFVCLPLVCNQRFLALVVTASTVLTGLFCLWFQFSASVPMMAIAIAGFVPNLAKKKIFRTVSIKCAVAVLLVFFLQLWAFQYSFMTASRVYSKIVLPLFIFKEDDRKKITLENLIGNRGPGSIYFSYIFRTFMKRSNQTNRGIDSQKSQMFMAYERIASNDEKKVLAFHISGLFVRSIIALNEDAGKGLSQQFLNSWSQDLTEFLDRAPLRSDMASTYFFYCLKHEQDSNILELTDRILLENSEDPIGLWFSGLALLGRNENLSQGERNLRKAMNNGIEKYIPVDPMIRQQLLKNY